MFTKALLALSLVALVHARPFVHDRSYRDWVNNYVRDDPIYAVVTATVGETATPVLAVVTATATASATTAAAAAAASTTLSASQIGDFGTCSVPQIVFGDGFDNRKETSFEPANLTSYNHGSAQNIDIITQFMCDNLVNSCGADDLAQQTCASAKAAADTVTAETGGQADAFNAVFGISTDFASVPVVNDQGVTQTIVATTAAAASATSAATDAVDAATTDAASAAASTSVTANVAIAVSTAASVTAASASANSSIGDFGSCSVPEIIFGTGFDGRRETAFEPKDQTSYNHGSADNIAVIANFICDALTNTCDADQTAKDTCTQAAAAAQAATAPTGAQADAFNAAFGIVTDFASVPEVSDTGVTLGAASAASTSVEAAGAATTAAAITTAAAATTAAATVTAAATATTSAAATTSSTGSNSSIGDFGSCSVPEINFGVGFGGRKETSFEPADLQSYNHGSADAIDIISQFICDQLTNACGADATAKATCATASAAADAQPAKTGAQADAFNAAFGITTTFADVPVVNDQGVTQTSVAARAVETGLIL